jgi:hypothetical protein
VAVVAQARLGPLVYRPLLVALAVQVRLTQFQDRLYFMQAAAAAAMELLTGLGGRTVAAGALVVVALVVAMAVKA